MAKATAREPLKDKPAPGTPGTPGTCATAAATDGWTTREAARLYCVDAWGQGYFDVSDNGHVVVQPTRDPARRIDLKKLTDEIQQRGLELPLLLRFTDILQDRVTQLHDVFAQAIKENEYRGDYCFVYPIKVNQQRHVIEDIIEFGRPYGFGVEAGSKPELLAVMAMVDDPDTPIICNGFKDEQYIEAVILAAKVGRRIIPIVEKFSELRLIVKQARRHHVKPTIGLRVKLAARGAGRWEESAGVHSKFGLLTSEVIEALQYLRKNRMGRCLKLLHFHPGSQVSEIRSIKKAIVELVRIYAELQAMGADLRYIDVGGGLGVDYDGSSINYSLQEYANDVIFHIKQVCDQTGVDHPTVISESGRALVAYHSVLVFNVVGVNGLKGFKIPQALTSPQRESMPAPVFNLYEACQSIDQDNFVEYYHDALLARDEAINLFNLGYCSLEHRSLAERLYFATCAKVLDFIKDNRNLPREFEGLERTLADTYFCNFSTFQSMPDCWAIDQLFPIMPIHRLEQRPKSRGVLADITCDSDGKVDQFIGRSSGKQVLELHPYTGDDYYLAAFLVGAYQEILGDLHNLFGDTNAVHVSLDSNGRPSIDEVIEGDTVHEVLQYVEFNPVELMRSMRKGIEHAVRSEKISLQEARVLQRFYESGLKGYTYLE